MEQNKAPIWDKLKKYQKKEHIWLHVPAHCGGAGLPPPLQGEFAAWARYDLTELPGLDDLAEPGGIIARAQMLAARAFGAAETFFLVNGASAGVRAMIRAVCNPGDIILIGRNAHRSHLEALAFTGAEPRYLPVAEAGGMPLNVTAEAVRDGLRRFPQAKAVFITSPSYYGVAADLAAIAELTREARALLLVDEAHGAHFAFSQDLPEPAGPYCDLRVQSWHKTLGALTPGAVLHCHGERIDRKRLRRAVQEVQTSSPSYPLLATLDAVRREMALRGAKTTAEMLRMAAGLRRVLRDFLPLFERREARQSGFDLDETRITVLAARAGICGLALGRHLSEQGIEVELYNPHHLLAIVSPGYKVEWTGQLAGILAGMPFSEMAQTFDRPLPPPPPPVCLPREVYFRPAKPVKLEEAVGDVAAEAVVCSPPGIPLLLPGERITAEIAEYLIAARQYGVVFQGIDSLGRINVCQ
jgi:arginine/lysine/ornithine decarboxylase